MFERGIDTQEMNNETNQHDTSDKDTKQTILHATVELIREDGFQCATLRNIAAKANTNLALVNYYYGSKEKLLGDAVRHLISTFDVAFKVLDDENLPPKERLKQFFLLYIGSLAKYPGLARKMLDQTPQVMGSEVEYARYSKMMKLEKIQNAIGEITGEQDRQKLMTMMMQLYGALVFPIIMFSCWKEDMLPVFQQPSIEEQIDGLFARYFNE